MAACAVFLLLLVLGSGLSRMQAESGEIVCSNGGTCLRGEDGQRCTCPPGYQGDRCETATVCMISPCLNGGTCIPMDGARYRCECVEGYAGDSCQHPSPCRPNPCLNGGVCQVTNTSQYRCECYQGYIGNECQRRMPVLCDASLCHHGGTCYNVDGDEIYCQCSVGKTGKTCESDVTCGLRREWLETVHPYVRIGSDFMDNEESKYGTGKECTCLWGYYVTRRSYDCRMKCMGDGKWNLTTGCRPSECRYTYTFDDTIANISRAMNYTVGTFAKYECNPGLRMIGDGVMECKFDTSKLPNNKYKPQYDLTTSSWEKVGDDWPFCVPLEDCGPPPNITHGYLVTVNSTANYGSAEYACAEGATMIGDSEARCWYMGNYSMYDRRNSKRHKGRTFEWIFVPKCDYNCPVPVGKEGKLGAVSVMVTKCTTRSFARYPEETCESANSYHVSRNESRRDVSMRFYGDDLCVGREVTLEKTHRRVNFTSVTRRCAEFCIPARHGYYRLDTRVVMRVSGADISHERVSYKYETTRRHS